MFTLDEFNSATSIIMSSVGNEAVVTEQLANILEGVSDTIATLHATAQENETLSKDNAKLKESNLSLFLRLSSEKNADKKEEEEEMEEEKPSFDKLFDEKGGLI